MNDYTPKFLEFLRRVECEDFETNETAIGTVTIQQSKRNDLRKEGVAALKADLEYLYGGLGKFDVVETKDGIVIVAENEPGDFTFSWEIKNTIKSLDYDPFYEADLFDDDQKTKADKKAKREKEKLQKEQELKEKRERKLQELEKRIH